MPIHLPPEAKPIPVARPIDLITAGHADLERGAQGEIQNAVTSMQKGDPALYCSFMALAVQLLQLAELRRNRTPLVRAREIPK